MKTRSLRWWLAALAGAAAVMATLVLLFVKNPASGGIFPPCPFLWLTGLYCPGCGALRAMHELMHLQVERALALNPLLVVTLPLLAAHGAYLLWGAGRRRVLPRAVYAAALGVIVVFWLLRNIPHYPFTLLAPH